MTAWVYKAQSLYSFCLAGEEVYIALDKGAINGQHVMLLPIEHWASTLTISANALAELERALAALRSCFASKVRFS